MTAPTTTWDMVRVFGTWRGMDGTLLAGSYTVKFPARVTDASDDVIIPAGTFAKNVPLVTTGGGPSLDFLCPATDDPDVAETGWKVQIDVTFTGGAKAETYIIDVPYANRAAGSGGTGAGVNLRTIALPATIPQQNALYKVGVPGGLAQLNDSGQVIDASGNPITGGTGGTVTSDSITDATAIGKALIKAVDVPTARSVIDAATSAQGALANTAVQPAALATYAPLASPALTGTPTVPTAGAGTNTTQAASTAFVVAAIAALINSAPGALDTLKELADAIGDDANFASTVTNALALKVATSSVGAASGVASLDASTHLPLAQLPVGGSFHVVSTDGGTTWKDLAGTTLAARPTSRTDVRGIFETSGSTLPAWAITGDLLFKIGT